ncbi:unnamed protein product [Notodromas monacha]|uniref:Uncharacterized protein n=1 Tax=Notodromas monacha TaxID=399045 RepID=A0A7R9G981_9CRUS|nr:unnamed protein product [Notodromas monacha]CAG0912905.1 unnamed protein product [Notodromas monacha]
MKIQQTGSHRAIKPRLQTIAVAALVVTFLSTTWPALCAATTLSNKDAAFWSSGGAAGVLGNSNNNNNNGYASNGADADDSDVILDAETEKMLREMLCNPQPKNNSSSSISGTMHIKMEEIDSSASTRKLKGVFLAQEFNARRIAYVAMKTAQFLLFSPLVAVGVEIPDYVTHQGTPSGRTVVNQQFKNVLDSAGRRK